MRQPLFITFEGGEGVGKSTVIDRLEKELQSQGYSVLKTREPGGTALGEKIRSRLLNHDEQVQIGKHAELLLFLAARSQHIEEVIQPALAEGKIVLCDRFNDSSIAYQGSGRELGIRYVQELSGLCCHGLKPDVTFFLDLDIHTGLTRAAKVGESDRIESEQDAFHQRVRKAFREIAREEPERFHILDASKSKEDVFEDAMYILEHG